MLSLSDTIVCYVNWNLKNTQLSTNIKYTQKERYIDVLPDNNNTLYLSTFNIRISGGSHMDTSGQHAIRTTCFSGAYYLPDPVYKAFTIKDISS